MIQNITSSLRGFTLVEILVALVMISFLTVTGLGIANQHLAQLRWYKVQQALHAGLQQVRQAEEKGLPEVQALLTPLDDAPRFRLEGEKTHDLLGDVFPLQISGMALLSEGRSFEGDSVRFFWSGGLYRWRMAMLDSSGEQMHECSQCQLQVSFWEPGTSVRWEAFFDQGTWTFTRDFK